MISEWLGDPTLSDNYYHMWELYEILDEATNIYHVCKLYKIVHQAIDIVTMCFEL